MYLYTIRDKVAEECGPVMMAKNDAVATRNYRQTIIDTIDSNDFELWCVGQMDMETGALDGYSLPRLIDANLRIEEIKDEQS